MHANDQDQIGSDKPLQNQKKMSGFDSLLLKHYKLDSQVGKERAREKQIKGLDQRYSKISLNIKADPFECRDDKSMKVEEDQQMMASQQIRQPLSQIKTQPDSLINSCDNSMVNHMNHPFARDQYHQCCNYSHNSNMHQGMPMQSNFERTHECNLENKENCCQAQNFPQFYSRPPYLCYLIQTPIQQNAPVFPHALYPYPIPLNQQMYYPPYQSIPPPPPPGFSFPMQNQQMQQYYLVNGPPPSTTLRNPQIPAQQPINMYDKLHAQKVAEQELPQFRNPNHQRNQSPFANDNTPTDDFSQSSYAPTTFSREYIKKKLDFNSPLSIMSFKKNDSPGNTFGLRSQQKKKDAMNRQKQNANKSSTITPKKQNKFSSVKVPHSDTKFDKKKQKPVQYFGDRVNNIFQVVEKLQQSKNDEINKESLSAEKAMRRVNKESVWW